MHETQALLLENTVHKVTTKTMVITALNPPGAPRYRPDQAQSLVTSVTRRLPEETHCCWGRGHGEADTVTVDAGQYVHPPCLNVQKDMVLSYQ